MKNSAARTRREEGFALAAAILAIVVLGALVTGGFFAASQEGRAAMSAYSGTEAFYMAEQGLNELMGTWHRAQFSALPEGEMVDALNENVSRGGRTVGDYLVQVRRMGPELYFIQSTGRLLRPGGQPGAVRRVGQTVRTVSFEIPRDRAIQIYGGLDVSGNSTISGHDAIPPNWEDCEPEGSRAGIVARDGSRVNVRGAARVEGDPPVQEDPDLEDPDFLDYGDVDFDGLAAQADKIYPAGGGTITGVEPATTADGACDHGVPSNWGAPWDPDHPCHFYFPIIYAAGDQTIAAQGAGQGILLVEGDLSMRGGFEFYGIIIVRGSLSTTGTGAHLNGVVIVHSGGELDTDSQSAGNSIVNYSSCPIQRASERNEHTARVVPITRRSWVDLSSAGVY